MVFASKRSVLMLREEVRFYWEMSVSRKVFEAVIGAFGWLECINMYYLSVFCDAMSVCRACEGGFVVKWRS